MFCFYVSSNKFEMNVLNTISAMNFVYILYFFVEKSIEQTIRYFMNKCSLVN